LFRVSVQHRGAAVAGRCLSFAHSTLTKEKRRRSLSHIKLMKSDPAVMEGNARTSKALQQDLGV
jgi:hypothetical protein